MWFGVKDAGKFTVRSFKQCQNLLAKQLRTLRTLIVQGEMSSLVAREVALGRQFAADAIDHRLNRGVRTECNGLFPRLDCILRMTCGVLRSSEDGECIG